MSTTPSPPRRPSAARRLTPVAPWPATGSADEHVRAEQVRLIFQQALVAQILGLVVALLLSVALWPVAHHARLLAWLAVLTPVTLGRFALVLTYRRLQPPVERMIVWERIFVISLVATSLVWGIGGVFIMPRQSPAHQAVVYFFLIGIAGGTIASYVAHAKATMLAIVSLLVPATIWLMFQNVLELRVMAVGGLLYLATCFRASRAFGAFLRRTFQLSWDLQQANTLAHKLAHTDELTGLANRRAFIELGRRVMHQAQRYDRPLALVMFDIDHFKQINDTHGHAAGDRVLQAVAEAVRRRARAADIPGRLGGEEFALLLPETTGPDAITIAERLRRDVNALDVPYEGVSMTFTCSFGVAARSENVLLLDSLLSLADRALYRAKHQGRNRVSRDEGAILI